uniref:Uncharacterized protein n=1 Tax=Tanacetum cinerariifolium TaxID=118510 RepID=A0A699L3X6_TANCI|nr:hypothetical protein [Tanacetum cinerariifolium]
MISEADFKNLHLNDFEDLYLLHLQGKLNHLPGSDKVHLYNTINLWIRNIVIRQRMGDLQLGTESYQTKLNLTKPRWDASDFLFKEDYTIISKLKAVIYRDRNDQKKMIRENEVRKFSNGTLTRVLHKLDHMVKDFRLYQYNPGMEYRIWSEDDKRMSEGFMESKSENKGIVPTEIELVLEQTQQGTSHEVSVCTEGVEELKRNVRIKGEKKEALHTLR